MNIPSCAGNCGCKDIVLALKWIKNNILAFGGDPNNVTIYGESAGACTINILSLSPMAQGQSCISYLKLILLGGHTIPVRVFQHYTFISIAGLFEKAIISAGNALVPWAFNDDQVDAGFRVGRALGFEGKDVEELAKFLRQLPAIALKDAAREEYNTFKRVRLFKTEYG